jgi:DNA (cytosine-5)-methyltransferase 1
MNYISLFSGAGGGDIASQHLKGWTCKAYVEFGDYAQQVLKARIADGHLDDAPVYADIRDFIADGTVHQYRGVDALTAGFPCQPFSVAGEQGAENDDRNMWPQTAECIRIIRPRIAYLENVAGLLSGSHGYFGRILGDLAELGYDAEWCVLSAQAVGAPHQRKRLWVVAHANDNPRTTKRRECAHATRQSSCW